MFWLFWIFLIVWGFIIGFKIFFRIVMYFLSRKFRNNKNYNNSRVFYYTSRPKYRSDHHRQHTYDDERNSSVREKRQTQIIDAEYQDVTKDK